MYGKRGVKIGYSGYDRANKNDGSLYLLIMMGYKKGGGSLIRGYLKMRVVYDMGGVYIYAIEGYLKRGVIYNKGFFAVDRGLR